MAFYELDEKPLNRLLAYITLLVGLGTFLDGYDLLNISVALPFLMKFMKATAAIQGVLGTATYVGGIFGALLFGAFSDLRGRKPALIVDLVFFFIASILSAFVSSAAQLIALRLAIGFGIGADIVSGPALLSEMLPRSRRGAMLGLSLLMMPLGGLASALAAYILYSLRVPADLIWRAVFALGAVPALIVVLLRSRILESPRWVAKFGDPKKHKKEFSVFGIAKQEAAKRSYSEIFRSYRKAFAYSSIAWFSAGTTSMLTIFTPMILERFATKGYPQMLSLTLVAWTSALAGAAISAILHDYVGRKRTAMASILLLGASYILLGLSLRLSAYALESSLSAAMFFAFMNVSAAYVIQTEVFPTEAKSFADGLAFSLNRVANFLFGSIVPVLLVSGLLAGFMLISGIIVIILGSAIAFLGIETKKKSLEAIERELISQI